MVDAKREERRSARWKEARKGVMVVGEEMSWSHERGHIIPTWPQSGVKSEQFGQKTGYSALHLNRATDP